MKVFAVASIRLPAFMSYCVVVFCFVLFFSFLSILAPSQYIWPFDLVLLKTKDMMTIISGFFEKALCTRIIYI